MITNKVLKKNFSKECLFDTAMRSMLTMFIFIGSFEELNLRNLYN